MTKLAAVPVLVLSAALLTAPAAAHATAAAVTTYYVDSSAGNDAADGLSSATAWRSLAKVNSFPFDPGNRISFKRGGSWTGTLKLSRSGDEDNPIVVEAHGSGNLPVVGGPVTNCVEVTGSNWFIGDLRASNCNWAGFELFGDNIVMDTIGNDNVISRNVISGHYAFSYDYGFDGAAVEIFNGNRNRIEYNTTSDNETFTELGRNGTGKTADGNVFGYNSVTSTKAQAGFLVTRGVGSNVGPVRGTVAVNNSVYLPNGDGFSCDAGCGANILKLRSNIIKVGKKVGYEDAFDSGDPADSADEDRGVYSGSQYQFTLGPNSVKADPLFISATDLRLKAGSPAIGRGENAGFAYDLAGKSLAGVTRWDAGAYQS